MISQREKKGIEGENIALFPVHRPGDYFWHHPAANRNIFSHSLQQGNRKNSDRQTKLNLFPYIFSKKIFLARLDFFNLSPVFSITTTLFTHYYLLSKFSPKIIIYHRHTTSKFNQLVFINIKLKHLVSEDHCPSLTATSSSNAHFKT